MDDLSYVQPIVLLDSGSHLDACRAAALASVTAWMTHHRAGAWEPWLAGRFTKTVRRARNENALERAMGTGPCSAEVVGQAVAAAFPPTTYDQMHPRLRKLQVTGLERPRDTPVGVCGLGPRLVLDADLGMSTGKAAAQTAHGLFAWLLRLDETGRRDWFDGGRSFDVVEAGREQFEALETGLVINDAGFTEVAAGSATVKVLTVPGVLR